MVLIKKIIVIIIVLLLIPSKAQAIEGYIELSYDFINHSQAEINMWQKLNNLKIGIKGKSDINYTIKKFVPGARPLNQYYEGYISYNINDRLTITGRSYCNHWFSQSGVGAWEDEDGLEISVKYKFGGD